VDLPRSSRTAAGGGAAAPSWRRRYGEARAEGDDPLGDHDYDVPTFLRRSAD